MTAQHAERERAPFDDDGEIGVVAPSGEVYTLDESNFDRDKLVLAAFRELLKYQDAERQRAAESKASRETASRYGEVFNSFEGLGATVRDRNWLLRRIPDAERDKDIPRIRCGIPGEFERLLEHFCQLALRPEDYAQDGMLTAEGRSRLAVALFHAHRFYLAERVGLGSIEIRSVTDYWFLTWLTLSYPELGAILTAATFISDGARTDEDLRLALEIARKPRSQRGETAGQAETRLAAVARNRWRKLCQRGAATPRDLIRFDDLRR